MEGIHDLGGKLGYGPVDVNEPEMPFHADYEGRVWAISRTAKVPNITIDWWRHIRELVGKDDYLNRPYFDSWAQTHMASMIDGGVFTFSELESGTLICTAKTTVAAPNTLVSASGHFSASMNPECPIFSQSS